MIGYRLEPRLGGLLLGRMAGPGNQLVHHQLPVVRVSGEAMDQHPRIAGPRHRLGDANPTGLQDPGILQEESSARSISMSRDIASISARWVKAWGKFPRCSPLDASISSP